MAISSVEYDEARGSHPGDEKPGGLFVETIPQRICSQYKKGRGSPAVQGIGPIPGEISGISADISAKDNPL